MSTKQKTCNLLYFVYDLIFLSFHVPNIKTIQDNILGIKTPKK